MPDPDKESGEPGDPVMKCDRNDVEVVNDLEEPTGIEMESEVEDEEPGGLIFAAMVQEPAGERFCISEESLEEEEEDPLIEEAEDEDEEPDA